MERGLEGLLTQRYEETISWINKPREVATSLTIDNGDDTIVEKIVSLLPEEQTPSVTATPPSPPTIQLHDPQAPDISRYFLVFRQGYNDYARLCVEKKTSSSTKRKDKSNETSIGGSPVMMNVNSNTSVPDIPAVLPLDSINPISATSTVLSASVSAADLNELKEDLGSTGHVRHETHSSWNSANGSPSLSVSSVPSTSSGTGPNSSYHSFRLYRTYASFYHTLGSGSERGGKAHGVQTQRQTSELEVSSSEIVLKETKYTTINSRTPVLPGSTTNNPALDAATAWKRIKSQSHTFKGHPLPSPEIPCDLDAPTAVKYVMFVVHGVGQRAWRKMGFHFNKDCDEMRNVLLDAAQARGLSPGSVTVLPVSWRAELNLAGNFTFGDEESDGEENDRDYVDETSSSNTPELGSSPPVDKDLKELTESFNTTLDAESTTFQRGVSVFEGQFTQILERLALESIPAVRTVLSDATMDILLYVSQKHFQKILGAVFNEVLRLHRLFSHWNPQYNGEFSFAAHSLGSALVADLLSLTVQPDEYLSKLPGQPRGADLDVFKTTAEGNVFPFKIDKFFAFGSPLGVFHLLKHTKPIGCLHSPHISTALEVRSRKWLSSRRRAGGEAAKDVPAWTVYNCRLFYNVFHPHDPVAHRFESLTLPRVHNNPLAVPLKIPYHKTGITRFKMDLEAKIARAKDDWAKFKFSNWFSSNSNSNSKNRKSSKDQSEESVESEEISSTTTAASIEIDENPLAAFNHHFRRVDFSLQDSVMENAYISALGAHFVYWSDLDIAAFIVSELIKKD